MMACAEICRISAHFMLLNSPHHKHVCKACAESCTECANGRLVQPLAGADRGARTGVRKAPQPL
jgi:hypothetical protein